MRSKDAREVERPDDRLHQVVVVAVPGAAKRRFNGGDGEPLRVGDTELLTDTRAVVNVLAVRFPVVESLLERLQKLARGAMAIVRLLC